MIFSMYLPLLRHQRCFTFLLYYCKQNKLSNIPGFIDWRLSDYEFIFLFLYACFLIMSPEWIFAILNEAW